MSQPKIIVVGGGLAGLSATIKIAEMGGHVDLFSIVPVKVPQGLHHNLPGHYTFVVERLQGGVPVEVLARRLVLVERQ